MGSRHPEPKETSISGRSGKPNKMCYYARTDYRCGDFKWGNMKLRCERQPRIGETCGAKLADTSNLSYVNEDCRICQDIQTKTRRLRKEQDNIARWRNDNRTNFRASIEKATRESQQLAEQIHELNSRRPAVRIPQRGKFEILSMPASVSSHAQQIRVTEAGFPVSRKNLEAMIVMDRDTIQVLVNAATARIAVMEGIATVHEGVEGGVLGEAEQEGAFVLARKVSMADPRAVML